MYVVGSFSIFLLALQSQLQSQLFFSSDCEINFQRVEVNVVNLHIVT